jgi:16S rRNA (uracil1498-N3)-methyltransferase
VPTVHRFYVPGPLTTGLVDLPGPAAHQVLTVLRLRPGAPLVLFDGRGGEWSATLATAGREGATARLLEHHTPAREAALRVTLGQALLKADRFEWVLQKGTELGVVAFQPLLTRRTVPGASSGARGAGSEGKLERWRRIVTEAAEQSGRCVVPRVAPPAPLEATLAEPAPTVLLWEGERERPFATALRQAAGEGGPVRLLVGPEGGFEAQEAAAAVTAGAFSATLGPRILRSETAALAAVALTCLLPVP